MGRRLHRVLKTSSLLVILLFFTAILIGGALLYGCSGGSGGDFSSFQGNAASPTTRPTPAYILKQKHQEHATLLSSGQVSGNTRSNEPNWILSGPYGGKFYVDDDIYVYLNGGLIFHDISVGADAENPIRFYANAGDQLRIVAEDVFGVNAVLQNLSLIHIQTGKTFELNDAIWLNDTPAGWIFYDETFTIPDVEATLSIKNAKATPEQFTPPDQSTMISATIVTQGFEPDVLQWELIITGSSGEVKRSVGTAKAISEIWNGYNPTGNFSGYGNYNFVINATATYQGQTFNATTSGTVKIVPPTSTVKRIEYKNSQKLTFDGDTIDPIYDSGGTNNEVCYNRDKNGATADVSFSSEYSFPVDTYYEVWATSERDHITFEKTLVKFVQSAKTASSEFNLALSTLPVQKIEKLTWYYRPLSFISDVTSEQTDSKLYITLFEPLHPFQSRMVLEVLIIACEVGESAETSDEAINIMVSNLYNWLSLPGNIEGKYDIQRTHVFKWGQNFRLKAFLKDQIGGNCADSSCLYQCCCAALGVPMELIKVEKGGWFNPKFELNNFIFFGWSEPASAKLDYHQLGYSYTSAAYDPTYKSAAYMPYFAVGSDPIAYLSWLVYSPDVGRVEYSRTFTVKNIKI